MHSLVDKPGRSRVAPVKGEPDESKLAADLVTLNHALRAAHEAREEAEKSKDELSRVRESLHLAQENLTRKTEAFRRHAAQAQSKQESLEQKLAGAAVAHRISETRLRWRTVFVLLALALAIAVSALAAFLFFRDGASPAPASRVPPVNLAPKPPPRVLVQPLDQNESVEAALKRLDNVLDNIPLEQVAESLAGANKWLKASGSPPCSVGFAGGDIALIVTPVQNEKGLLLPAIVRCARALEHVLK